VRHIGPDLALGPVDQLRTLVACSKLLAWAEDN
jgi:hypothetical protein